MLEVELSFLPNLSKLLLFLENLLKSTTQKVLSNHYSDLQSLSSTFENPSLISNLEQLADSQFHIPVITYHEALNILKHSPPNQSHLNRYLKRMANNKSTENNGNEIGNTQQQSSPNKKQKKNSFTYPIVEGEPNLQREHERYLSEQHFHSPVFVINYPKSMKPFYMKVNDDVQLKDPFNVEKTQTVACFDLLVPGLGELAGGSLREDNYDQLLKSIQELGNEEGESLQRVKEYEWYLDLRKYGSCPHGGFGVGFERLLLFLTGATNIRDVIPIPRSYEQCRY